jgi:hypothetical protein
MVNRTFAVRYFAAAMSGAVTALTLALPASASAAGTAQVDDGYATPFAQAVRTATAPYRLALWARSDKYIQSTDYLPALGAMYTNHERFNPADLAHPSMLVYDEAGRLVACGYQFTPGAKVPAEFAPVPASAWYEIPKHVHYNAMQAGVMHYAQAPWETDEKPTAEALRAHGLLPPDATLEEAFIHPATRAILVWAWLPNADGLFAGENALLP